LLDSQSTSGLGEAEESESSETSEDDDDYVNGVDRRILWSSNGSIDFKKHAKDYFPCSFHPISSR